MSVTVSERKMDEKRRVTLPTKVEVKPGGNVVMIASKDAAVIASDRLVAERLAKVLRELETERKIRAIEEWAKMIEEAGLTGLRSKDIDKIVGRSIARKVGLIGREKSGD